MAGGASSENRRGPTDVDAVRERISAARKRRVRDDTRGTVLGAVVRMLDTPPVTEESDPGR